MHRKPYYKVIVPICRLPYWQIKTARCNRVELPIVFFYLNNNLSIVVLTQNKRCKIIPKINKNNNIIKNLHFGRNKLIIYAASIVNITSTIAILNILYECSPLFTLPKMSLYLQNIYILK
jgi:hypothetical protein